MATSTYDEALRRLLLHEGGYTNNAADPGGPTNFGITIFDYRKYVKPDATAADVKTMRLDEAKAIYRAKYWDALRCDALPAGVDDAVFDYGVNSGIGRSGKVLRRCLNLADDSSAVTDRVIAAAMQADAARLVSAICDERLRFLQSLRTWPVFGKGWGRRVAEVKAFALALAAGQPATRAVKATDGGAAPAGKGVVPVAKAAQQGSSAAIVAAGAAVAAQAQQSDAGFGAIAAIMAVTLALALAGWMFWRVRQQQQQHRPA